MRSSRGWGTAEGSLELTNYPASGPIVSGPHQDPFICQTEDFELPDGSKLGPALDEDCTAPERVTYLYLADGSSGLEPLGDPSALPGRRGGEDHARRPDGSLRRAGRRRAVGTGGSIRARSSTTRRATRIPPRSRRRPGGTGA